MIKLLLVDDETDLLESMTQALSRRGFAVAQAADGRKVLKILGEQRFDAVVLDVKMPGIDGVEVFRRIRLRYPDLPVIMLTGHGNVQQAFETSRDGVYAYLTKPCEVEKLAETVRRAVTERPAASAPPVETTDLGRPTVLFVDDEKDFVEAMGTALRRRDIDLFTAGDATQAQQVFAELEVDVVISDVRMPGMDGIELLKRLKRQKPLTEVIVLTGQPTIEEAIEGLREGAFDFLTKPQSVDVLVGRIREAYRLRQQRLREIGNPHLQAALDKITD